MLWTLGHGRRAGLQETDMGKEQFPHPSCSDPQIWPGVSDPLRHCHAACQATYWVVVHAVVVALLYRKAAGLHWLSLMDHIRQSKAAHSRGKQGGGCGWIRGLLCLKVPALCLPGTRQTRECRIGSR